MEKGGIKKWKKRRMLRTGNDMSKNRQVRNRIVNWGNHRQEEAEWR